MKPTRQASGRRIALRIVLIYVMVGTVWILVSDALVAWLSGPHTGDVLQSLKGWGFVAVTGLLLYLLLRRYLVALGRSQDRLVRIHRQASYDSLTGLANRSLFLEHMARLAKQAEPAVAVLTLDIDHFRDINRHFGLVAGDRVLIRVGELLGRIFDSSCLIARTGADEFAVAIHDLDDVSDLAPLLQETVAAFDQLMIVDGQEVSITTSIGVATSDEPGESVVNLLPDAQAAMAAGGQPGRNRYHFHEPGRDRIVAERITLEQDLRQAIRDGQLLFHYQPYFTLADNRLAGLEALLRWHHPQRGDVPPAEFIPALEQSGLLVEIGEQLLAMAARQIRAWRDEGLDPVPVSVNLSPEEFADPGLIAKVQRAVNAAGIEPHLLGLEITERTFMADVAETGRLLERFREMHVPMAIDDFGTGYSSLRYLKLLPVGYLKIDRSFVANVAADANDASLVTAIITMAHQLGLKTIAEGIETEDQLRFLKLMRCDRGQGYLLGRPVPPEAVPPVLQAGACDAM